MKSHWEELIWKTMESNPVYIYAEDQNKEPSPDLGSFGNYRLYDSYLPQKMGK